ncbi:MAG: M15 family metallopeptidase [Eubacteriales bacterium]
MKKYIVILLIALLIGAVGCGKPEETTVINGVSLVGEVTLKNIEINASINTGFISPSDNIVFSVEENYEDEKGNIAKKPTDDFTMDVDNTQLVDIEGNDTVKVLDDVNSGEEFTVTVTHENSSETFEYVVRKTLASTIDGDGVILNPNDIDVLVNKERSLPSNYIPGDLVRVSVPTCLENPEVNQLRKSASDALTDLFKAAEEEGYHLVARSGYRSYLTQKSLRQSIEQNHGKEYADKYSAQPGESEHQTGLAMDITSSTVDNQLSKDFGITQEGIWVKENAHNYGFIIRYPLGKEDVVGYEYEPWHLRYMGKALATQVYQSGLTFEEYFE